MTVIAAVARDGHVVMAADRQVNYHDQATFGARKIRRITSPARRRDGLDPGSPARTILLAGTGNGALLPTVARGLVLTDPPAPRSPLAELTDWAETVAQAVTELAAAATPPLLATDQQDGTQALDGALLLGYAGQLWYVFAGQVSHVTDGIATLGAGGPLALGAAHASLRHGDAPTVAVLAAVTLACQFVDYCGCGDLDPQLEETT